MFRCVWRDIKSPNQWRRQRNKGRDGEKKDSAGSLCQRKRGIYGKVCVCVCVRERVCVCVCERASAECNKRRSYSVRGRGEEKVEFEKKLLEKKEETLV